MPHRGCSVVDIFKRGPIIILISRDWNGGYQKEILEKGQKLGGDET